MQLFSVYLHHHSITHKDTIKIEITKWHKHAKMI
nr:MAG TPA: hypothetical protein [Caudoviricetes sp.]